MFRLGFGAVKQLKEIKDKRLSFDNHKLNSNKKKADFETTKPILTHFGANSTPIIRLSENLDFLKNIQIFVHEGLFGTHFFFQNSVTVKRFDYVFVSMNAVIVRNLL